MCIGLGVNLPRDCACACALPVGVTNLSEPLRALATSTIAWVRSQLHPFWAIVNKSNAG